MCKTRLSALGVHRCKAAFGRLVGSSGIPHWGRRRMQRPARGDPTHVTAGASVMQPRHAEAAIGTPSSPLSLGPD